MSIMKISTSKENDDALEYVKEYWRLGPEIASIHFDDNKKYWDMMGAVWNITPKEASRKLCANCEYYNNTTEAQEEMESIPFNKYDLDGGGRGYCVEFDFICHNLRTCQRQENKKFINEDENDLESSYPEYDESEDTSMMSKGLGKMKHKIMMEK